MARRPQTNPAAGKAGSPKASASNDKVAQVQRLIEVMVKAGAVEVEMEEAGSRLRVRLKEEPAPGAYAAPAALAVPASVPLHGAAPAAAPLASTGTEPEGEVFKSPMLGTFYRAVSPEAEPFAKAGDRVGPDTTLCIIEAMKVMNEIKAEKEFEIVDVLVKNGDPVEYGQPLFQIRF